LVKISNEPTDQEIKKIQENIAEINQARLLKKFEVDLELKRDADEVKLNTAHFKELHLAFTESLGM